jgi:hypothetical protein
MRACRSLFEGNDVITPPSGPSPRTGGRISECTFVRNGGALPLGFDDLMSPPAGQAPYLTQEPVAPTNWQYVFGDNALTADITETIHITCSALPDGITQDDINSW